jgi:hypothetical protein
MARPCRMSRRPSFARAPHVTVSANGAPDLGYICAVRHQSRACYERGRIAQDPTRCNECTALSCT